MLHVISVRCLARDLHTTAPGPPERTCWRRFMAQWGDCKKSWIAPLNPIIIIIAIIIIIIIIIIINIIIIRQKDNGSRDKWNAEKQRRKCRGMISVELSSWNSKAGGEPLSVGPGSPQASKWLIFPWKTCNLTIQPVEKKKICLGKCLLVPEDFVFGNPHVGIFLVSYCVVVWLYIYCLDSQMI